MPRAERKAQAVWEGNVARGSGRITGLSSGVFKDLEYSLPTRIGAADGKTSPEELLAAAHAACFAMALSGELTRIESPPERLEVEVVTVLDEAEGGGHRIVASHVEVDATVPGLDEATFHAAVAAADEACPFSALIRASAAVTVAARLA